MEMNETRLDALMQSYGAAPERWPETEMEAALALLRRSDRARRIWVEAAALDALLVPAEAPLPSEDLASRLKALPAEAATVRRRDGAWRPFAGFAFPTRLPAVAAFAAIALAFVLGLATPLPLGLEPAPAPQAVLDPATAGVAVVETQTDLSEPAAGLAIVDNWDDLTGTAVSDQEDLELAILDLDLE